MEDPRGSPVTRSEDLGLVERLLARDEDAFTGLVRRYHGRLLRLAQIFVSDRALAEEVVQETWLAVLNGLPDFEGRSALKTWIFRILVNRAKTRGVREGRWIPLSPLTDPGDEEGPAVDPARFAPSGRWAEAPEEWVAETPEEILLREETRAALERAIAALPPSQRAVVTLRDVEDRSAEEVCNILELSETNQRVLLHRGRSRLRRALEQHLGRK